MSDKPTPDTGEEKLSPLDKARALIKAERDARRDAFGKAVAKLHEVHRCEFVAIPGQAATMLDGTTVISPPSVGIRVLD